MTDATAPDWRPLPPPPTAPRRLSRVTLLDPARIIEGVGIALESIRVSKVRAALTILGVAIGVMVVIAMASMITGINRAVSAQLEQAGPRTFMLFRNFRGGVNIDDGSEREGDRNPYLSVTEAQALRRIPGIEEVAWREDAGGPVSAGSVSLGQAVIIGATPNMMAAAGGKLVAGRNFTEIESAAGSYVAIINDRLADRLFPSLDPLGRRIKIFGVPFTVIAL